MIRRQTDNPAVMTVEDLTVTIGAAPSAETVLDGVSFELLPNEILGIVGETGAGKSMLARALMNLLPEGAVQRAGRIALGGKTIGEMSPRERQKVRGGNIALIGTNAKALLDPVQTVGRQIVRVLQRHRPQPKADAWQTMVNLLTEVGIVDPANRANAYPHELSGGMAQRVVIAMALVAEPAILLADDATLGLDATVSVQVLDMLVSRCKARGLSVVLITHDLGIIAHYCQRVAIMRRGRFVEIDDVNRFLAGPALPYSQALLAAALARPLPATHRDSGDRRPLLEVTGLVKLFPGKRPGQTVRAVDNVSFVIERGQTLALVGESGSGKTTIGQCLIQLLPMTSGIVTFDGQHISAMEPRLFRPLRKRIQMVFQEPYVALNPRWQVRRLMDEPLRMLENLSARQRRERVAQGLDLVNLPAHYAEWYPHELSAGEQKRVGIARALISRPDFVIFDEPTTALDIRVRAQIIDLIRELQSRMHLTALFITHDLNSVRSLAHHVAVMNKGRIVEQGPVDTIFNAPADPYTLKLLSAELSIEGKPPAAVPLPSSGETLS
ncbi:ATP-binding cassette domain-containing protein [Sodalis ligni]|uniref:Peptide/nickel transport system ATP-binding protein n=1 Tax=Sodalis ligni TaxID=2697027 RepID=A0A4R1N9R5_9GAMM|nr:ABC transporter ATP-binding protein [Sodalis ligni]TCL03379.1 peptide/nickel transport system ATP-binding protein [Sodalis ligni]